MNKFYVYMYLREDGTPYYVGKGYGRRAYSVARTIPKPPKDRIVFPYTNLTEEDAFQKEVELIVKYGRKDIGTGILRNLTSGGEGASGLVLNEETRKQMSIRQKLYMTPENRKKLSIKNKLSMTPEKRKEISERNKLIMNTPEMREKISIATKKAMKAMSPDALDKIRKASLGIPKSAETKEKMRQAQLGRNLGIPKSAETKEKLRQAQLGRKLSPETIEKIRQAQLKTWNIRLQTKALRAQNAGLDNFLSD
jgi:hypothetical protein